MIQYPIVYLVTLLGLMDSAQDKKPRSQSIEARPLERKVLQIFSGDKTELTNAIRLLALNIPDSQTILTPDNLDPAPNLWNQPQKPTATEIKIAQEILKLFGPEAVLRLDFHYHKVSGPYTFTISSSPKPPLTSIRILLDSKINWRSDFLSKAHEFSTVTLHTPNRQTSLQTQNQYQLTSDFPRLSEHTTTLARLQEDRTLEATQKFQKDGNLQETRLEVKNRADATTGLLVRLLETTRFSRYASEPENLTLHLLDPELTIETTKLCYQDEAFPLTLYQTTSPDHPFIPIQSEDGPISGYRGPECLLPSKSDRHDNTFTPYLDSNGALWMVGPQRNIYFDLHTNYTIPELALKPIVLVDPSTIETAFPKGRLAYPSSQVLSLRQAPQRLQETFQQSTAAPSN